MEKPNDPLRPTHCADMLKALAAPERLRIIQFLRAGPRCVTDIASFLATTQVNVSHHVRVLAIAGLLRKQKQGRFVIYSLAPGVLDPPEDSGDSEHINLGCCRLELPSDPTRLPESEG